MVDKKYYIIGAIIALLIIVGAYSVLNKSSYDAGYSDHSMDKYRAASVGTDNASKEYVAGFKQYQTDAQKKRHAETIAAYRANKTKAAT